MPAVFFCVPLRVRIAVSFSRTMIQVQPFFAVPFGFAQLEDCAPLNAALRSLLLQRASEGPRYANPRPLTQRNDQVFESEFQLFRATEAPIQQLKQFCWSSLLGLIAELNKYDEPTMRRLLIHSDSWFHVTRRGGFFGLHNHPNASWSGVYCVSAGEHDADRPDSGLLSFLNPATMSTMHSDAANANMRGAFGSGIRHVKFAPGQLVLFPSWVLHDVKPFEGEGERITIAFNCWFGMKEG